MSRSRQSALSSARQRLRRQRSRPARRLLLEALEPRVLLFATSVHQLLDNFRTTDL